MNVQLWSSTEVNLPDSALCCLISAWGQVLTEKNAKNKQDDASAAAASSLILSVTKRVQWSRFLNVLSIRSAKEVIKEFDIQEREDVDAIQRSESLKFYHVLA